MRLELKNFADAGFSTSHCWTDPLFFTFFARARATAQRQKNFEFLLAFLLFSMKFDSVFFYMTPVSSTSHEQTVWCITASVTAINTTVWHEAVNEKL